MKKPTSPKERNLVKGAMRRVFSRSELRQQVLKRNLIEHSDPKRPRVKKWAWCEVCGEVLPAYTMAVDHRIPLVPIDKTLEDMSWDEVVERLWCDVSNLQLICTPCHKLKSSQERKQRKKAK
jgi:5-methylcytosine-specific restriction endonuclease McrA